MILLDKIRLFDYNPSNYMEIRSIERLIPVTKELPTRVIDFVQVLHGLVSGGILLEDIKKYRDFQIARGLTLENLVGVLALADLVYVDNTENGLVLRYFDDIKQSVIKPSMIQESAGSRRILREEGVLIT